MRVMPAPVMVPRWMEACSRMIVRGPMTVSVGSPWYLRSCGARPIVAKFDAVFQHDLRADGAERADFHVRADLRTGFDDRRRVNQATHRIQHVLHPFLVLPEPLIALVRCCESIIVSEYDVKSGG